MSGKKTNPLGSIVGKLVWALVLLLAILSMDLEYITSDPVDLGLAQYPQSNTTAVASSHLLTPHQWRLTRIKAKHTLTYALRKDASKALAANHLALASKYRVAPRGSKCLAEPWSCIYADMYQQSSASLAPLLQRIRAGIKEGEWTQRDVAAWLLAFVQQIPYKIPEHMAFQVAPPAIVVSQDWGDCDSKSLLYLHLLDAVGIDAEMVISRAHAHAMVVVRTSTASGKIFKYRGRAYAWAETTAKNAPLGYVSPDVLRPNDWRVIPFKRKS